MRGGEGLIWVNEWERVVPDIAPMNIYYVAKKQTKDIRELLNLVNDTFTVVGAGNEEMEEALAMETPDWRIISTIFVLCEVAVCSS
jgi:hypothetical protein